MIRFRKNKQTSKTRQRQVFNRADYENRRYLYHSIDINRVRDNQQPDNVAIKAIKNEDNEINFFNFWLKRIIKLFLVSIIVVGLVRFSQLSGRAVVTSTNPSLNPTYTLVVDNFLSKSIFDKNKFTFNENQLNSYLKSKYPDIKSVKVSFSIFNQNLKIAIIMSPANIFLSTTLNAGLINNQGRVIDTNLLNQKNYVLVNYPINLKLNVGSQVLTTNQINFIQTIVYQLNNKGIVMNRFVILPGADELDVYLQNKPYFIKFNLNSNDPIQQSGTFLALYHYLSINNINPSQYIDVRIDGRAYFK